MLIWQSKKEMSAKNEHPFRPWPASCRQLTNARAAQTLLYI
ncbi:hypothetical protein GBL_1797 [Geobacillus kaustophilus GBlys]|uniref:Uncharacterized protein n=1 Tax=Geobacillus kaustophilus GBlys TaxID=1337888 RepID=U2X442_GEOKU|nr:hypothetical protein GBL_1797 [Geobacillus kaustophilus GBlys]